jgi:ubiquinone/menaquinone biosynthesis C-methylase UbiE
VNPRRVEDLLGARVEEGGSRREMVVVPTGHFLRSSHSALEVFALIAEKVATNLLGRVTPGRSPATWTLQRAAELERLRRKPGAFDAQAWWSGYLRGTQKNPFGFDLLALTDEYEGLLADQVELLGLSAEHRVADLGCGTGNALAAIIRNSADIAGTLQLDAVDFVPNGLETARRKVARAVQECGCRSPTVRYQTADLSLPGERPNLPFGDGSFDAVLLSLVLPYLSDPVVLLRDVERILRPGGRLVVSTLRPDVDMSGPLERLREKVSRGDTQLVDGLNARHLTEAIQDYIHAAATLLDHELDGRFRFYELEEFEALLRNAGFRVEQSRPAFGDPALAIVSLARKRDG